MAASKASASAMDTRKSATGSTASGGKHGEKKDENFLMKTAHSIRDKVHEFTDEVKGKTHNLTHGGESKKSKKNKDPKNMTSAKSTAISGSDPTESESDGDEKPKPTTTASSSNSTVKKDKPPTTEKGDTSSSRSPSSSVDSTTISAKKDSITPTPPKAPTATSSSNDQKDNPPPAASSSAKPSGATVKFKEPESEEVESKPAATKGNSNTNQPGAAETKNKDQVHISFDGVATVDDLLDRIDKAIEQAKIIVEGGKGNIALTIDDNPKAPTPTVADLEKKPVEEKPEETNPEEPIRFNSGDVHTIEDLLVKVNNQPGSRKVVMDKSSETPLSPSGTMSDNEEGPTVPKSILKTSQNPSSLETSTKTASFEDDQVHVNVEGVKSADDTVQQVPVSISPSTSEEKKQDPKPTTNTSSTAPAASSPTEKREAPKAPAPPVDSKPEEKKPTDSGDGKSEEKKPAESGDSKPEDKKPSGKDDVPTIHVPEHEYDAQSANAQASKNNDQKPASVPKEKEQDSKPTANASSPAGKREAPKAPAPAVDRKPEEKKPSNKDDVPPTNVAEHKREGQSANTQASTNNDQKLGPPPKEKEQAEATEWI